MLEHLPRLGGVDDPDARADITRGVVIASAEKLVADVKHGLRRQVEQLTQPRDAFSLAPDIHPAVVAAIERTVRRQAGGGAVAQLSQLGLQPQHHFIEELGAQCRRARALRASCLPLLSTHHQPDRSRLADDATAELQLGGGRLDDLVGCVEERAHRYLFAKGGGRRGVEAWSGWRAADGREWQGVGTRRWRADGVEEVLDGQGWAVARRFPYCVGWGWVCHQLWNGVMCIGGREVSDAAGVGCWGGGAGRPL
mmetsp:Transcript_28075/g.64591  ORF Transcript_28075/g.64591 Transcript_28075/m.64591 type:complete len:253 (+) Transcript_28075:364-1122(+)